MKITFLGTTHGYAEYNRYNAGTLIEAGDGSYLIDAGAPIEYIFRQNGKRLEDINAVFISHMHNDHVGSLSYVASSFLRYHYNDKATIFMPEKAGIDTFVEWLCAMHDSREKIDEILHFEEIKPGMIYKDENLSVEARHTTHVYSGKFPAYSFVLYSGGKKVLFTNDIGMKFSDYKNIVKDENYDLVVCEMAHCPLKDAKDLLAQTKTKRMLLNHCYPPQLEGYEEIFPTLPFDIQLTFDGMEVII